MAMRFEHEFTVPVPAEDAWTTLLDVERVAPCLPGAALDSVEGEEIAGRMKVKVGPITVTYRGTAVFQEVDKDARSVTINASGKESRGAGTASATVTARLHPSGDTTRVTVETSFNVTGRPAQFGRGVMADVGAKLIDRFAANLSALLAGEPDTAAEPTGGQESLGPTSAESGGEQEGSTSTETGDKHEGRPGATSTGPTGRQDAWPGATAAKQAEVTDPRPAGTARTSRTAEEEALDLLEIAGAPVLKRLAPVAGGLVALLLAGWLVRRMLRRR
jgi:carbon monoxide dehydrogenase subunit G